MNVATLKTNRIATLLLLKQEDLVRVIVRELDSWTINLVNMSVDTTSNMNMDTPWHHVVNYVGILMDVRVLISRMVVSVIWIVSRRHWVQTQLCHSLTLSAVKENQLHVLRKILLPRVDHVQMVASNGLILRKVIVYLVMTSHLEEEWPLKHVKSSVYPIRDVKELIYTWMDIASSTMLRHL
jgi:hypothetical protein